MLLVLTSITGWSTTLAQEATPIAEESQPVVVEETGATPTVPDAAATAPAEPEAPEDAEATPTILATEAPVETETVAIAEGEETLTLSGTVMDEDGNPLEGVGVSAFGADTGPYVSDVTDADGKYSLSELPERAFYYVNVETYAIDTSTVVYRNVGLRQVDWAAGEITFDIELARFDIVTVTGTILDLEGAPVLGVRVCYNDPSGGFGSCADSNADGEFGVSMPLHTDHPIRVIVGTGDCVFNSTQLIDLVATGENPLELGDISFDCAGTSIPDEALSISGTVTDDSGNPIEGVTVRAWDGWFSGDTAPTVMTGSDGRYIFSSLPERDYYRVIPETLVVPGQAVFRSTSDIRVNWVAGELTVDFELKRYAVGAVSGVVKDQTGAPLTGFRVCLTGPIEESTGPAGGSIAWNYDCVDPGSDGLYSFPDSPHGQYVLSVDRTSNPDNFMRYRIDIDLTLDSASHMRDVIFVRAPSGPATIFGVITDEHGAPIAGADVCHGRESIPISNCPVTGLDGSYNIENAEHGEYRLGIFADGYEPMFIYLQVGATPFEANVVLSLTGTAAGTITDLDNNPIEGASICTGVGKGEFLCVETGADGRFGISIQLNPDYPRTFEIKAEGCVTTFAQVAGSTTGFVEIGTIQLDCGGPEEPEDAKVRGQILDGDGAPLEGAAVCLDGTETCATTDGDGYYSLTFTELPGASGTFTASLDGYELQSQLVTGVVAGREVVANFILVAVEVPVVDPVAELSTERVQPAARVTWTISQAAVNAEITIEWVRENGGIIALETAIADSSGAASGTFAAPAVPGGAGHLVRFTVGSDTIEIPIAVAARISPTPTTSVPGETISVNLRGFAANDPLQILWRVNGAWVQVAGVRSSPTGSVTGLQILVPANAEAGANTIRVSGTISQQSSAFTVIRPAALLDSTRATVGTRVGFTFSDFPANSQVEMTWVRLNGGTIALGTVTTDAGGAATGQIEVPAAEGGPGQQIRFTSGAAIATATFEIAARIRVTPAIARPGETVSLNLRGFKVGDPVRIMWRNGQGDFVQVGSATTSSTGSVTGLEIVVPNWAPSGVNTLRANGAISGQTSALTIESPSVVVTPMSGTVNTRIRYTLERFPADSQVTITWNRLTGGTVNLGTVTTDATGSASGDFLIPATPGGSGQIVTFVSSSVSATAMIAVNPRVKVTPSVAAPGETIDISLRGLPRQEPYVIRWRAGNTGAFTVIASGTTSNTGSANVAFTIPASAVEGPYQLRVEMAPYNLQTNAFSVGSGETQLASYEPD